MLAVLKFSDHTRVHANPFADVVADDNGHVMADLCGHAHAESMNWPLVEAKAHFTSFLSVVDMWLL